VPGYYGLSDLEGIPDAYRLVYTYRLDDAGAGFKYTEWHLRRTGEQGRVLLRYAGKEGWKWIAVKESSQPGDVQKCELPFLLGSLVVWVGCLFWAVLVLFPGLGGVVVERDWGGGRRSAEAVSPLSFLPSLLSLRFPAKITFMDGLANVL
jgi:hypothetical protein